MVLAHPLLRTHCNQTSISFLDPGGDYAKKFPALSTLVLSNWGLFNVSFDGSNEIYNGYMYVDTDRSNSLEEKHLLREELTQSLGLAKDSNRYPDSIFQASWTTTTEYSDIDKDLVRLLYHPSMQTRFRPVKMCGSSQGNYSKRKIKQQHFVSADKCTLSL